jgi:hypothetical protein
VRSIAKWLSGAAVGAVLISVSSVLAQEGPKPSQSPRVHNTPCALAESMASKLVMKGIIEPARAKETCQMLAPTMTPEQQAEFMRCCMERLTKGNPSAPKALPDGRQGT